MSLTIWSKNSRDSCVRSTFCASTVFLCCNFVRPCTTTPTTTVRMATLIINSIKVNPFAKTFFLLGLIGFIPDFLSASANSAQGYGDSEVQAAVTGGCQLPRRSGNQARAVCGDAHHVPANVIGRLPTVLIAVHIPHTKPRGNSANGLIEIDTAVVGAARGSGQRRALSVGGSGALGGR